MAGGQTFRANLARHAQKRLELHVGVAVGAGDGRAPGKILLDKGAHHALLELLFEIDDVVRKIQVLRHALGVVHVVERAAAMLRGAVALQFGQAALIPELHGEADDGPCCWSNTGRHGGRIDTAGHGYGDEAGLSLRGRRQGIEMCLRGHAYTYFTGKASVMRGDFFLYGGESWRSCATAAGTISRAASISAAVV